MDIEKLLETPVENLTNEEIDFVKLNREEYEKTKNYYVVEGTVDDDWFDGIIAGSSFAGSFSKTASSSLNWVLSKCAKKFFNYSRKKQRTVFSPTLEKGTTVYCIKNEDGIRMGYWVTQAGEKTYVSDNDVSSVKKSALKIDEVKSPLTLP